MGILPMSITGVSPVEETSLRGEGVPPLRVAGILPAVFLAFRLTAAEGAAVRRGQKK